eukprot:m.100468 g.100468  ORF g.100468 m.100468 type:complete len:886 (+) comp15401_c0_seq1:270-2927(+)
MTSLQTLLPGAGAAVWRSEGSGAGTLAAGTTGSAEEALLSEMRVRHIVIRETHIHSTPKPHVVYQIEVMTQADQWTVMRRYSEFHQLQAKMAKLHAVKKDLLPSKRLTGNLSQSVIEKRRELLERYLQRLINSDKEVVFSPPLLQFLEVNKHNVITVTNNLARHLYQHGEEVLRQQLAFHMTPTQCRCVSRRLRLPLTYQASAAMTADTAREGGKGLGQVGSPGDIAHLYDFVYNLPELCVHPPGPKHNPGVAAPSQPIETASADLSVFKSLRSLKISYCTARGFTGLAALQNGLESISCSHAGVSTMKEIVRDAVAEKRAAPRASGLTESWRSAALGRLMESRSLVRPWLRLTILDLSHNSIAELDPNCLVLLPTLEQLSLSYNLISNLDEWLRKGTTLHRLKRLDMSHNSLFSLVAQPDHGINSMPASPTREIPLPTQASPSLVISPGWNRGGSFSSVVSEPVASYLSDVDPRPAVLPAQPNAAIPSTSPASESRSRTDSLLRPTPLNTLPPSYDAAHLISTEHPDASLQELQRLRALRLSAQRDSVAAEHANGQQHANDSEDGTVTYGTVQTGGAAVSLTFSEVAPGGLNNDSTLVAERNGSNDPDHGSTSLAAFDGDGSLQDLEAALDEANDPHVHGHVVLESAPAVAFGADATRLSSLAEDSDGGSMHNVSDDEEYDGDDDDELTGGEAEGFSADDFRAVPAPDGTITWQVEGKHGPAQLLSSTSTTPALSPHPSPLPVRSPQFRNSSISSMESRSSSICLVPQLFCTLTPALTEIHLANNQLTSLKGLERLPLLQYVDVRNNKLKTLPSVACLINLPVLNQLLLTGNPVADCKSYWLEILARFTGRGESSWGTLIIDDHTPTQKHKAKIESLRRAQPHH